MDPSAFDLKALNAKDQISDALRIRPVAPPPQQRPQGPQPYVMPQAYPQNAGAPQMAPQAGPQQQAWNLQGANVGANMPMGPGNLNVNVGLANPQGPQGFGVQGMGANYGMPVGRGQFNVGMQTGPDLSPQYIGGQYSNPDFSAGLGYSPEGHGINANLRVPFAEGGMATSVRENPEYHERDVDFLDTRNRHLREMVGRYNFAQGGRPSLSVHGHDISGRFAARRG